uniref:Secreted protein n=1 Tax=Panagrellus redivivus TaxID=6233 RepID=A0A7E4ZYS4_PANRE
MKFLQLLCIALLLSAAFAAPLNTSNATEVEASLKTGVEKLADLKSEIEKMKREGKSEDRMIGFVIPFLIEVVGEIAGEVVKVIK